MIQETDITYTRISNKLNDSHLPPKVIMEFLHLYYVQ